MDSVNWRIGSPQPQPHSYSHRDNLPGEQAGEDMDFWKSLLSNHNLRSRFIRDLEIQSIKTRSTEDLARRYREEEILPGAAVAAGHRPAQSKLT
jgi:hypothetical protein